jgi:hypothetical protein
MVHCLTSDEFWYVNIFSANKVAILCSVDLLHCLLNCITETIQVAEGHRYSPLGHMMASPALKKITHTLLIAALLNFADYLHHYCNSLLLLLCILVKTSYA